MNDQQPDKQEISRDEKGRFKDGVSGNPNGRPKFSLVSILKEELQKCPEGEDKKTYAELLIKRILKEAIQEGNDSQIRNILQYIEGMPKQTIKQEFEDEITEIEFKLVRNKDEIDKPDN